jgi:hypothetical protein
MSYGVTSIERIARAVHHDLNLELDARLRDPGPSTADEVSDGSAPSTELALTRTGPGGGLVRVGV